MDSGGVAFVHQALQNLKQHDGGMVNPGHKRFSDRWVGEHHEKQVYGWYL